MYLLPALQRGLSLKGWIEGRLTVYYRLRFLVDLRLIRRPMAMANGLENLEKTNPLA